MGWLVLAAILAVCSLGLRGILGCVLLILLAVVSCVLVSLLVLFQAGRVSSEPLCSRIRRRGRREGSLGPRLPRRLPTQQTFSELTGSETLDQPIQDMIGYIIRDYIDSWYKGISPHPAFPDEVRQILCQVVTLIMERIASVDWVSFLTTRLVDDVASHVRLFKSARYKYKCPLKEGEARSPDLETIFFDFEVGMEGEVCRDQVCLDPEAERQYLQDLCEMLCYLILPKVEFGTAPVRCLVREILVGSLVQPGLGNLADPDFVNQTLVWLYSDYQIKTEVFVSVLRHTESTGELEASRDLVTKEVARLRSRDKSEDNEGSRLQLNSLLYLRKVIDTKINRIQSGFSGNSYGLPANIDWSSRINPNTKLFNLPLEVVMKNNIALSYFIDYMTAIGCQYFVFFYLNIEGWKVSAEQQLQAIELDFLKTGGSEKQVGYLDSMREAALSIYQEYLSDKASPRLLMDDSLTKKLLLRIRSEPPDPGWFDEVAAVVHNELQQNEKFLSDFKRSVGYLKLLAELDLLKGELDEEEDISIGETCSTGSGEGSYRSMARSHDTLSSSGSGDGVLDTSAAVECCEVERGVSPAARSSLGHSRESSGGVRAGDLAELGAEIKDIDLAREPGGKQFVNYVIAVRRKESRWEVLRRFSDFFFLHQTLTTQFPKLFKIPFPGKKTFGNLERNIVAKRQKMFNSWMSEILSVRGNDFPGLYDQVFMFLSPGWEADKQNVVERAVSAARHDIQRSVKTASHAITAMPSNIVRNVDSALDGITKAFHVKDAEQEANNTKVGAGVLEADHDNIPLRITLLLLDEVFDLKDKNIWLRRQMITVLRQIVKTMFGDTVNKRIVDYFTTLTATEAVAGYLNNVKDHLWPGGFPPAGPIIRDDSQKLRTSVAAKAALYSSLSDELRRVIGSETSRAGLAMLFEMLQFPSLNKRLVIVILEGIIKTVFPEQDFNSIFLKLHSRSSRIRNDLKNSHRTSLDLRRH